MEKAGKRCPHAFGILPQDCPKCLASEVQRLRSAIEDHKREGAEAHIWHGPEDFARWHDERNRKLYVALHPDEGS